MSNFKTAAKPNYFNPMKQLDKQYETKTQEKIQERNEEVLASLADHEGWEAFKEIVEQEVKKLSNLNKEQMSTGATFEELGRNAVMVQLCQDIINSLVNKVEDVKEAVETRRNEASRDTRRK